MSAMTERAMTEAELRRLPASIDAATAFRAIGIGRTKGYELLRDGQFPVPVLRLGNSYRVRTADLLGLLGIEPLVASGGGVA